MAADTTGVAINDEGPDDEEVEQEKNMKTFEELLTELKEKKAKGKLTKDENEEVVEVSF